jgi:hypothetical protein
MKQPNQIVFLISLFLFLLLGIFKLSSYQKTVSFHKQPPQLNGKYCTTVGGLNLYLKSLPLNQKEFSLWGEAGGYVVKIKELAMHKGLYLGAPPLNHLEYHGHYYSKVRPLVYKKNGVVRAFRYHDMIFDQSDCGENNG